MSPNDEIDGRALDKTQGGGIEASDDPIPRSREANSGRDLEDLQARLGPLVASSFFILVLEPRSTPATSAHPRLATAKDPRWRSAGERAAAGVVEQDLDDAEETISFGGDDERRKRETMASNYGPSPTNSPPPPPPPLPPPPVASSSLASGSASAKRNPLVDLLETERLYVDDLGVIIKVCVRF